MGKRLIIVSESMGTEHVQAQLSDKELLNQFKEVEQLSKKTKAS